MADTLTLKLANVSKSFSRVDTDQVTHAVADINLELRDHEFVSIVGPSGCGKSTILRMIAGLVKPTTGSLTVNDRVITGPGPQIGMVFQKPTLFPWLTVRDNIAFSLRMQGKQKEHADDVERMIRSIGLEQFADDYPGQLSGGMAQRVALGRALISKPEILLLDEPLGALDAFTRMKMQREILDMWNITRQLVVMITHDVDEAVYMSTRVFVMEGKPGKISHEIPIQLERPRSRGSEEFVRYRNQIMGMMSSALEDDIQDRATKRRNEE